MDYNLEKSVKYEVETELKSLYAWSLIESQSDSKKTPKKWIPFDWGVYFMASKLAVVRHVSIDRDYDADDEKAKKLEDSEIIIASLHSGFCNDGKNLESDVNYTMFGTDRKIESFELKIHVAPDGLEGCSAWATPSYNYELDFGNHVEADVVEFNLFIQKERWESIAKLVQSKAIDALQLRLSNVSGFYSEWSPAISTNAIKVLTSSHSIEGDEKIVESLSKIGEIGAFRLTAYADKKLNVKRSQSAKPIYSLFEDEFDGNSKNIEPINLHEESDSISNVMIAQISNLNIVLGSFKKLLWGIAFLLLLIVLK